LQSQIEAIAARKEVDQANLVLEKIKSQARQVQDRVHRDALTGIYSRGYLDLVFDDWLRECVKSNYAMSLLFLDIDRFKPVNDTYGHKAGDAALCKVAEILKQSTRAFDLVIRYGGDEFIVLLQDVSRGVCQGVAERIRGSISAARLSGWPEVKVTTSVGGIFLDASDVAKFDQSFLVSAADRAMYQAKQLGRNQVVIHGDPKSILLRNETAWGDRFLSAQVDQI
jgi:diguanylate cyclase (GGDEF)-like protein